MRGGDVAHTLYKGRTRGGHLISEMSSARKHTPRGGFSDAIVVDDLPDVYVVPFPLDENTVLQLIAGMIAVLVVVMRMVSGTAPVQDLCMTCMCLLFKEGSRARRPCAWPCRAC